MLGIMNETIFVHPSLQSLYLGQDIPNRILEIGKCYLGVKILGLYIGPNVIKNNIYLKILVPHIVSKTGKSLNFVCINNIQMPNLGFYLTP